ncbi:hypothetical protein O181_020057 [Austropuccinia psidii MF-1]|uniref:Uncharacterized protein n=1 Tax=Austropuccinia psidii MF-1 TaxID=1389203 RepID=A0A9Q3GV00_9BASI|nr:hypothetical protein [Austropuccinia psidii MF-1]
MLLISGNFHSILPYVLDCLTTRSGKLFSIQDLSATPSPQTSNMGEHSKLPDISNLSIEDPVLCANKQAEILQRFSLIADCIRPKLSSNGSNFNSWLRNLFDSWSMCFVEDINYFQKQEWDADYRRNLIALSFIRNNVDRPLYDSIIAGLPMPNARTVYQAVKRRFSKASWSSIVHHARLLFHATNHQHGQGN